ncbi:hypothetical protein EBZ80_08815 [bacterium]|nr:hypothetical protein [bacterium]
MEKRLVAVVAAARANPVFHPLIPLAHNPCLCILLETVLSVSGVEEIRVLAHPEQKAVIQTELNRWFPEERISIHTRWDDALRDLGDDDRVLVVQTEFPLLSRSTLLQLTRDERSDDGAVLLASRLRNHGLYTGLTDDGFRRYPDNDQEGTTCFCGAAVAPVRSFVPILSLLEEDADHVVAMERAGLLWLSPATAAKECAVLRSHEDKNYLEEVYMENRNADFIYQFYSLWKRCSLIESRLESLEEKMSR